MENNNPTGQTPKTQNKPIYDPICAINVLYKNMIAIRDSHNKQIADQKKQIDELQRAISIMSKNMTATRHEQDEKLVALGRGVSMAFLALSDDSITVRAVECEAPEINPQPQGETKQKKRKRHSCEHSKQSS